MPRCYFLPDRGEIRSSADRHPVGRKSLTPNSREGGTPPSRILNEGASVSETNASVQNAVVLKIGGSILTGTKAFGRVALFLKRRREKAAEEKLVVVVSAQKGATDTLERTARRIVRTPNVRALDLLWSTGELRSVALVSLSLQELGVPSVGLNVHEAGLRFSTEHQLCPARPTLARRRLAEVLADHSLVIVPGFLGTRADGAVVSLGRGGSDLSAVLVAVGLKASRCELLKDVPGYYEEDPRENACARHLPSLSFDEALAMADRGCELVQQRALLAAAEAGMTLVIRSMDERAPMTVISRDPLPRSRGFRDEPVAAEA
jgi:aspartate kinase